MTGQKLELRCCQINTTHNISLYTIQLNTEPYNSIHFSHNAILQKCTVKAVDLCVNVLSTYQLDHCDTQVQVCLRAARLLIHVLHYLYDYLYEVVETFQFGFIHINIM